MNEMRQAPRKSGNKLHWVFPALLACYLFVRAVDFVWFRAHVPVGFQNARWSGRWETQEYWGLSGRLLVRLPDPLPQNQDFRAEALVYYPVYSAWKTGQFVRMDFTGHFSPDSPMSAGQSTNKIPSERPVGGKLKFKGTIGNQVVEYAATIDDARTQIVGGYLSQSPYDQGYFHIRCY
jgi:hypothetical protein